MKRSKILASVALVVAAFGMVLAVPAFAETSTKTTAVAPAVAPSFAEEVSPNGELAKLRFGQNQLFAGGNLTVDGETNGLLFAFGNQIGLNASSEYAFVAGNLINYEATAEKDLFVAGNRIDLKSNAKIGRDVYAAGYRISLASNLKGDFSAAANQVVLRDVEILGNVNLDASSVDFEGKVSIAGALTYNDDAVVAGLDNVKAAKVETYTPETYTVSAAELWFSKLISIISLVLTAVIVLALSARLRNQVAGESAPNEFGSDLVVGFLSLLAVPAVAIVLLISFFAAPLGLTLIVAYIIALYLAQALAGAWFGHLLVSKVFRTQAHIFVEAIIGIALLGCLSMVPGLNIITGFLATLLGLGILVRSLKSKKNPLISHESAATNSRSKSSASHAKTAKKPAVKKPATKKKA